MTCGPCPPVPTRRTLLRGSALAGLAAPVAACAGSGGEGAAPEVTGGDRARVALAEVPVGSATYLEDAQVLVAQPEEGTVVAYDATCPHQGCRVSLVQGELLVCPCHGSRFEIGTGEVVEGPAETGLTELAVEVDGEDVRVTG